MENTNNAAQAVKIIRILGEEYQLIITNEKEEPRLREIGGFCDNTSKKCVVRDFVHEESTPLDKDNLAIEVQRNIRHEIVHAFLLESGLDANSGWADNEELVDWIALQGPKIYKVWQEAGVVEDNLKNPSIKPPFLRIPPDFSNAIHINQLNILETKPKTP